jgi:hypothetical protein
LLSTYENSQQLALSELRKEDWDKGESNLFALPLNPLEYSLESAIGKATILASLLVILVSCTHSLGSKIEGISERFVNTSQYISAGHEDLSGKVSLCTSQWKIRAKLARSKAVLHALGWVATKIGLVDMIPGF